MEDGFIGVLCVASVGLGSLNDVLSKVRSVAFGPFNYTVGFINAAVYILVYGVVTLYLLWSKNLNLWQIKFFWPLHRCQRVLQTPLLKNNALSNDKVPSRSLPLKLLMISGLMDGAGNVLGFLAQQHLPQVLYSLFLQDLVIFSVFLSVFYLGKSYTIYHYLAVCITVCSGFIGVGSLTQVDITIDVRTIMYMFLATLSTLPTAISFICKEKIFSLYRQHGYNSEELNIFVLGLLVSGVSLVVIPLMTPLLKLIGEIPDVEISTYLSDSYTCIVGGVNPILKYRVEAQNCQYAAQAYLAYVSVNTIFNIAVIGLTRAASTVMVFLMTRLVLPTTGLLLLLKQWPLINTKAERVNYYTAIGIMLALVGASIFRYADMLAFKKLANVNRKCTSGNKVNQLPNFWPMVDIH